MQNQISKTLTLMACAVLALAAFANAQSRLSTQPASSGTFVPFDIPGAGTHANQGTVPRDMNQQGMAVGYYIDDNNVNHGFAIGLDGTFATFDAPEEGTGPGQGTQAYDVSPSDNQNHATIVGLFYDQNSVWHGFLRAPDATIKAIDTPLDSINASLETAGFKPDANGAAHAYVRSPEPDGTLFPFDVPEAGTGRGQGTFLCPGCLNDRGDATGHYIDSNNVPHAFIRWADGTITTFLDGLGESGWASKLNNKGQTCGFYLDANNAMHGFIRNEDGSIVGPIDAKDAGTGSGQGTWAYSINDLGVVFGYYINSANVSHGFVRSAGGTFRVLDAPGAGTMRGGTRAQKNIDSGLVVGNYIDNNLVQHGYYWVSLLP